MLDGIKSVCYVVEIHKKCILSSKRVLPTLLAGQKNIFWAFLTTLSPNKHKT